jgi:hypothetical protein
MIVRVLIEITSATRSGTLVETKPNAHWSFDFVHDQL